jgi:hypothetical protein
VLWVTLKNNTPSGGQKKLVSGFCGAGQALYDDNDTKHA